jgi:hypothetical protein
VCVVLCVCFGLGSSWRTSELLGFCVASRSADLFEVCIERRALPARLSSSSSASGSPAARGRYWPRLLGRASGRACSGRLLALRYQPCAFSHALLGPRLLRAWRLSAAPSRPRRWGRAPLAKALPASSRSASWWVGSSTTSLFEVCVGAERFRLPRTTDPCWSASGVSSGVLLCVCALVWARPCARLNSSSSASRPCSADLFEVCIERRTRPARLSSSSSASGSPVARGCFWPRGVEQIAHD